MIRLVTFDLDGTIKAYIDKEGTLDRSSDWQTHLSQIKHMESSKEMEFYLKRKRQT